jgi:hypothetical protein
MTLGERCDEIVRLIEETLGDVGASTNDLQASDLPNANVGDLAPTRSRLLVQSA